MSVSFPWASRIVARYGGAGGTVAVAGLIAAATTVFVPQPRVSVLFLCAVLASAALWGVGPSIFAALLGAAVAAFFFYPPIYNFGVDNPQDLLDLVVFAVAAVLIGTLSDKVRRIAAVMEEARVRAKTDELREALLNSISHDLKTPLASIIGSATSLQSFGRLYDAKTRADLIATIREEAERLNHFIGNILDLTRIRAGDLSPRFELVELADIVDSALRKSARALASHDVRVSLPGDLPMLRLDLFLMEHALINLLENAAKFSPDGSRIDVTAEAAGRDIRLTVRDRGIGIAANDVPLVFGKFYRGETDDAKAAGSGLGLAICRAFVEANGGKVEASSHGEGHGAIFGITLPAADAAYSELELADE